MVCKKIWCKFAFKHDLKVLFQFRAFRRKLFRLHIHSMMLEDCKSAVSTKSHVVNVFSLAISTPIHCRACQTRDTTDNLALAWRDVAKVYCKNRSGGAMVCAVENQTPRFWYWNNAWDSGSRALLWFQGWEVWFSTQYIMEPPDLFSWCSV